MEVEVVPKAENGDDILDMVGINSFKRGMDFL